MQGFVQSYWDQQHNVAHSHKIMYYFAPGKLPVLHALAQSYAVFNGWFSSIPGPTVCNRAFAHYGTSFGQVNLDIFYVKDASESIYERMLAAGRTTKLYYFDPSSSTQEVVNLLKNQPQIFGTYQQFLEDCKNNALPDYSFVEPNYSDHPETTAENCWRRTSIRITTCKRAKSSSRRSTTPSAKIRISGKAPRC